MIRGVAIGGVVGCMLAVLAAGIPFSWGCTVLMLLGSQWYILFNVLAGASAVIDFPEASF